LYDDPALMTNALPVRVKSREYNLLLGFGNSLILRLPRSEAIDLRYYRRHIKIEVP
jgi:hypothetical protein